MLTAVSDHLTYTFAALADPTRRAILARLSSGAASVTELAEPFEMSLPAISKHLKVLERAHLIARGREAQWRPCRLEATPLKEVADWVEHYRQFWTESFDRLDAYLRTVQVEAKAVAKGGHAKSQVNANKPARARKKAVKGITGKSVNRGRPVQLRNRGHGRSQAAANEKE